MDTVVPPDDIEAHGDSDDEDFDLYAIVGDSNNGAYRQVEQRTGPPLAYVAEKVAGCHCGGGIGHRLAASGERLLRG